MAGRRDSTRTSLGDGAGRPGTMPGLRDAGLGPVEALLQHRLLGRFSVNSRARRSAAVACSGWPSWRRNSALGGVVQVVSLPRLGQGVQLGDGGLRPGGVAHGGGAVQSGDRGGREVQQHAV
jgi:hypothetical protein